MRYCTHTWVGRLQLCPSTKPCEVAPSHRPCAPQHQAKQKCYRVRTWVGLQQLCPCSKPGWHPHIDRAPLCAWRRGNKRAALHIACGAAAKRSRSNGLCICHLHCILLRTNCAQSVQAQVPLAP
eukprot:scaffold28130_cov19-Tisochrysis_lutea.AAC.1